MIACSNQPGGSIYTEALDTAAQGAALPDDAFGALRVFVHCGVGAHWQRA